MSLLDKAKTACRVYTDVYNDEMRDLIYAGLRDIGITDINEDLLTGDDATIDPLVRQAVLTWCKKEFGEVDPDTYARLDAAYKEQKAQMSMSSDYTTWVTS